MKMFKVLSKVFNPSKETKTSEMTLNNASYIGFDLETVRLPPKRQFDDTDPLNVGISCASLAYSEHDVKVWQGTPSLTVEQCQDMVAELERIDNTAQRVVTWNGSGFDYRVLAEESQLRERCIDLMIHHIDLMFLLLAQKGWLIGFQNTLQAMQLEGKKKVLQLQDGSVITNMEGDRAPELWEKGEYAAVIEYNKEDSIQILKLAHAVHHRQEIRWSAKSSGKPQRLQTPLLSVKQCMDLPLPDLSWMNMDKKKPVSRQEFLAWALKK